LNLQEFKCNQSTENSKKYYIIYYSDKNTNFLPERKKLYLIQLFVFNKGKDNGMILRE